MTESKNKPLCCVKMSKICLMTHGAPCIGIGLPLNIVMVVFVMLISSFEKQTVFNKRTNDTWCVSLSFVFQFHINHRITSGCETNAFMSISFLYEMLIPSIIFILYKEKQPLYSDAQ